MKLCFFISLLLLCFSALAQTNIALNKPVIASSYRASTTLTPDLTTDGKTNTRWASEYSDNQWLVVDLLNIVDISGIRIHWHTDYAVSYTIETSIDGNNWTTAFNQPSGLGKIENITLSANARYIRLFCHKRLRTYGFSLWEILVFSETTSANSSSLNSSTTITKSSSSIQSSSASSTFPINSKLSFSWKPPVQRENGEKMTIKEVAGYEIQGMSNNKKIVYNTVILNDSATFYETTLKQNDIVSFEIAVFDTNGLYSRFVPIKAISSDALPRVKNLRLRIE